MSQVTAWEKNKREMILLDEMKGTQMTSAHNVNAPAIFEKP